MSDLFETQDEVSQVDCIKYAESLVRNSVKPVAWQGFHSYTLLSGAGHIVQFRSEASPLDISMTTLAKAVHRHIAPATTFQGLMPNSSVTVWIMEALPGIGYLFTFSSITVAKIDTVISDLAKFFASAWKNPQTPVKAKIRVYKAKLIQLSGTLPSRFATVIERIYQSLDELVYQVPWVLTHSDLSNMNILVDPDSGHLTGVVDWADASIEPFGIALWGLESVLGCSGPHGWTYHGNDASRPRELFRRVLLSEIGGAVSDETRRAIEEVRTLGLLLRYGFSWVNGGLEPTQDTTLLDVFLQSELDYAQEPTKVIY